MYVDLKRSMSKNDSGQGHVRLRDEPDISGCVSVDGSMRGKHIGAVLSSLSLFFQKLETKTNLTSYELG